MASGTDGRVEAAHLARFVGELEIPMATRSPSTTDDSAFEYTCAMRAGAARSWATSTSRPTRGGARVLLHAGVLGAIVLDGAGMIAAFDHRNELVETGPRGHVTSKSKN
jgi:hypothetical protein